MPKIKESDKKYDNIYDLIDKIKRDDYCPHFVWRGVSDYGYELKSRVGRKSILSQLEISDMDSNPSEFFNMERTLFEQFRARARIHEKETLSDIEWLAIAQHYGLPTRLLDWTENPLIALYFACQGGAEDGALFLYHMSKFSSPVHVDPFKITKNVFVLAPYVTQRLAAQGAIFSVSPNPWREFLPPADEKENILKLRITAKFKQEAQSLLPKFGINRRSVYADLGSYAEDAWEEFLRSRCKANRHRTLDLP